MTPDQIRADERARIMARLEARAVSEDITAERCMMLLDLSAAQVHMHAATVLREEARAIAALGPAAPVDDALLLRVAELVRDACALECASWDSLDLASHLRAMYGGDEHGARRLAAIIARAKGGA